MERDLAGRKKTSMFRDFVLTFTGPCKEYLQQAYAESELIVEYGSGGSTCHAAEIGKTVIAVESSVHWLLELVASCAERGMPGRIVPLWSDIGDTKEWGFPVNDSKVKQWHRYATLPWLYCADHELSPDTVLIDGRFRVACFIATCMAIRKPTRILFDDFTDRPHYHGVLELSPAIRHVGNRMAVFEVDPGAVGPDWLLRNIAFFLDPR